MKQCANCERMAVVRLMMNCEIGPTDTNTCVQCLALALEACCILGDDYPVLHILVPALTAAVDEELDRLTAQRLVLSVSKIHTCPNNHPPN